MKIFSQRKSINLIFIIALIILTATAFLVYFEINKLSEANRLVRHTHEVIETTNQLEATINNVESRVTLYMLTGNQNLISRIPELRQSALQKLSTLQSLIRDNPLQQQRTNLLEKAITTKFTAMSEIINLYPINRQASIQLAAGQSRLNIKDQIDRLTDQINQTEADLLAERTSALEDYITNSNLLLLFAGLLGEFLFISSFILLNYHLTKRNIIERKRMHAEQQLLLSNKRLREIQERFKLATEGSNAGLWDWEPGSDRVYFSPYYKKMLGFTEDEFPNTLQSFEKVIHPDDRDRTWKLVNEHLENHTPYIIEYRLRTKNGDYKWFQAAGQALWDQKGNAVRMSGSIIDITERKKTEKLLAIQHAATNILIEADSLEQMATRIIQELCSGLDWELGAMWVLDKNENVLKCIGYWQKPSFHNHEFEEATFNTKLAPGTGLIGHIWEKGETSLIIDIIHEKNFTRKEQAKRAGLKSAFYFPLFLEHKVIGVMEFYIQKKEKLEEPVQKILLNVSSLIEEFIKRKQSEISLRESEGHKRAILESASDSIITINTDGRILSCNPQTATVFKYQPHNLINRNIEILLPDLLKKIPEIGQEINEFTALRKNGDSFPCELTVSKMAVNKVKMFVLIIRDITERKKIDQMKNEFISIVSHELRTPLTSIQGSLDLLHDGTAGPLTTDEQELVSVAKQNSDRLIRLINDILDIEKIESGKLEFKFKNHEIDTLIQEAISANQAYANKFNIKLIFSKKLPNAIINVDHDKFLQSVTNLLSNAIKFSPANGEVSAEVTRPFENIVRVAIKDQGPGISQEFRPRIFQKFVQEDSTASRKKGGTGLGLSITKSLIENMRGKISFTTSVHGTTFYFDLPIVEAADRSEPESTVLYDKKATILICEDDPKTARFLEMIFNKNHFEALVTNTAAQAKQILHQENVDALILDLVLPDQDGISLIKELRSSSKTHSLPIVVISIKAQHDQKHVDGSVLEVLDWIDKPIETHRLVRAIASIKKQINENAINILYIEDDKDLINIVTKIIQPEANIVSVSNLKSAREALESHPYDLAILDLVLPDGSGVDLLPELSRKCIPVIIFSAYEFPEDYAHYVKSALVKSKTTNKELLDVVRLTLKKELV